MHGRIGWLLPAAITSGGRPARIHARRSITSGWLTLLAVIAGVSLVVWVASLTLIAVGRAQTTDHLARIGPVQCDGTPCFHALIPGATLWTDAQRMVDQDWEFGRIAAWPLADTGYLEAISMTYLRPIITVGDMVARFGAPACVESYGGATVMLHYPTMHIMAEPSNQRFSPATPIHSIVVGNLVRPNGGTSSVCDTYRDVTSGIGYARYPWRGFALPRRSS